MKFFLILLLMLVSPNNVILAWGSNSWIISNDPGAIYLLSSTYVCFSIPRSQTTLFRGNDGNPHLKNLRGITHYVCQQVYTAQEETDGSVRWLCEACARMPAGENSVPTCYIRVSVALPAPGPDSAGLSLRETAVALHRDIF